MHRMYNTKTLQGALLTVTLTLVRKPPDLERLSREMTAMSYIIAMFRLSTLASGLRPSAKDCIVRCHDADESGEGCDDGGFEEHVEGSGWEVVEV